MLLMTIAAKSLSFVSAGVTRVTHQGFDGVKTLIRAIRNRRAILRLSELDERDLKDIGLVRSDVEGALATSWFNDPSSILGARSSVQGNAAAARREEGLRQASVSRQPASARLSVRTVSHSAAAPAAQTSACSA